MSSRKAANEKLVSSITFYLGALFFLFSVLYSSFITENIILVSTYMLIISGLLLVFAFINNYRIMLPMLIGMVAFSSINLGVILAGVAGLHSDDPLVVAGLSRIVLAVFIIWKLTAEMRHLTLEIDPFAPKRGFFGNLFYGILFPRKEFFRLIKVMIFVVGGFYFVMTGLLMINQASVDLSFFQKTERISLNILFLGMQTPMMMASRASVSRTFSEYIKNLQWLDDSILHGASEQVAQAYNEITNSSEISFDSINSNGKHLWLSVVLILVLQAYEGAILQWDIVQAIQALDLNQLIINVIDFMFSLIP